MSKYYTSVASVAKKVAKAIYVADGNEHNNWHKETAGTQSRYIRMAKAAIKECESEAKEPLYCD